MPNTLKIKRGTAATIPQGQLAEPLFTTDTYDLYIGKGSGGNQRIQNYIASGTSSQFLKGDGSLDSTTYQATSEKGQNNGYASLDAGGKIPASQLPSSVIEYKGTWNASTNTPTLADGTGDAGDVYIVSVGGTQNLGSGSITFDAGDWVMYNGSVWQKSTGSNAVASVNGQTGIVSIGVNDLDDATITSPSNGQLLQYSTGTNKWVNWTPTYISAAITSLNGLTGATQTFANDTNVTITSASSTHTIGWDGQLAIARGGTGLSALGTAGQLLRVNTGATALEYFTPTYISAAITSLNGLTVDTQTFATGTTGTDFNISSASGVHTFNIPSASAANRGLVTTGAQTFAGDKTLTGQLILKEGTDSTDYTKGLRFPNDPYGGSGDISGLRLYRDGAGTEKMVLELYIGNDSTGGSQDRINFRTGIGGTADNDLVTINDNKIWNAGNLTNPVTGTGSNNYISKFTSNGSTIGNSRLYDNGSTVQIGSTTVTDSDFSVLGTNTTSQSQFIADAATKRYLLVVRNNEESGAVIDMRSYGSSYTETIFGQTMANSTAILSQANSKFLIGNIQNKPIIFGTNDAERVRITEGGSLYVTTKDDQTGAGVPSIQLAGNNSQPHLIVKANTGTTDVDTGYLIFARSAGTTDGSKTLVGNNDRLGMIRWEGADGVKYIQGATIMAEVDGTAALDDLPTRLIFQTTADGASSPTTRLTINNAGLATFTNSVQVNALLGASDDNGVFYRGVGDATWKTYYSTTAPQGLITEVNGDYLIRFYNAGTPATRFTFTTSGNFSTIGSVTIGNIPALATASDAFVVSDSGTLKYRTAAQVRSDIGAQAALTNPITGDGSETSGNIAFFTGNTTIAGTTSLNWDNANGRMTIGKASTDYRLEVYGGTKPQIVANGGTSLGAGIALLNELSGTDRRNWIINTESTAPGDFEILRSTAAGGTPNIVSFSIVKNGEVKTYNHLNIINSSTSGIALYLDNSGRASGKMWSLINGNIANGAFSIKNETDNTTPFLITGGGLFGFNLPADGTGTGMEFAFNTSTPRINFLVSSVYTMEINSTSTQGYIKTNANIPLVFGTNDTPKMRIEPDGYVYINTSGALQGTERLAVTSSTNTAILAQYTGGATSGWAMKLWNNATSGNNNILEFTTEASITARGSVAYNRTLDALSLAGSNALNFATNGANRMFISSSGLISINTTSTLANMRMYMDTSGANISGTADWSSSNTRGIMLNVTENSTESIGIWFRTGGNHLSGISGQRSGATGTVDGWATDLRFYTHQVGTSALTTATERMRISSEGEVWIGYTADQGGYLLQVNGSVLASAYYESSDIRLKDVLTNSYSENFSAIEFMWKDKRDEKKHWGYAAQDVMKYIPDAIEVNKDGMMTVNYNEAHTWKIAQLEKEILQLKAKIK